MSNVPKLRFKEFSGEWEEKTIKEVSTKVTDGTHDTPKPIDSGIPYLTAIHVKDGFLDFDNCYFLPEDEHNKIYKRCNPEYGDLLLVNIGAGTATTAMVKVHYEFSLKNVALIKPNRQLLEPEFLYQVQHMNAKKLNHKLTSGGAQPFLSLKEIAKIKLNIPSKQEQEKIASFLTSVDTKVEQLTKKEELLQQYKKGVMQKIFNQEIRFKADDGSEFCDWEEKKLGGILDYIQPTKYLVKDTEYNDNYIIPVLTAGKTFILGYTNETDGVFEDSLPVIIFDDFTTANKFVNFPFKAKSSAMKILVSKNNNNIKFIYEAMQMIKYEVGGHERHWISKFSFLNIFMPCVEEQSKIANFLSAIDSKIEQVQKQINSSKEFKKALFQKMFI